MGKCNLRNFLTGDYTDRYWRLRKKYLSTENILLRCYYYLKIKRIENKSNADFGVSFHDPSAVFKSRPNLPHGLNGIIISREATVGKNVTIFQ